MTEIDWTKAANQWIDVTTLADLLIRTASRRPLADAIVFETDRLKYSELVEGAKNSAQGLMAMGIKKSDHVGIMMPNSRDFVEILFGAAMLGAIVVPINTRLKATELPYIIENADLALLFISDLIHEHVDFVELLEKSLPEITKTRNKEDLNLSSAPKLRSVVLLGEGTENWYLNRKEFQKRALATDPDKVDEERYKVRVRDAAIMMYTSGTTAQPKGCPLTHEALIRTAMAVSRQRFLITPEDVQWSPLPMFHLGGIVPLLATIDGGGTFVSMAHFEENAALRMIEEEQATIVYPAFPTITQALIHHPEFKKRDLKKIRLMVNVAPPDTLKAMQEALPDAIQVSAYGCTEVSGLIAHNQLTDTEEQRFHTCGEPYLGVEVRIADLDSGEPKPSGEKGEIVIRGYSLFEGYYRDPEKTSRTIDADGWFHSGDIGMVDPAGRIVFLGRAKDMLKVGGENVAAAELESYLGTHPAVKIAQVVGVPDPRLVEVPAAFIELHSSAEIKEEDLIDYCRGKIATFKIPRYIRFVKEWPMSATKIQKFQLRDQFNAATWKRLFK